MIKQFTTKIRGIVIAKQGKKLTSSDPNDFVFKMTKPTASIKLRKSFKVTTTSVAPGLGRTVFKHNFGYIPQVIAFVTTASLIISPAPFGNTAYLAVPGTINNPNVVNDLEDSQTFDIYADAENIYMEATHKTNNTVIGIIYIAEVYTFDVLLLMEEAK